jgi:hypothetical protein
MIRVCARRTRSATLSKLFPSGGAAVVLGQRFLRGGSRDDPARRGVHADHARAQAAFFRGETLRKDTPVLVVDAP